MKSSRKGFTSTVEPVPETIIEAPTLDPDEFAFCLFIIDGNITFNAVSDCTSYDVIRKTKGRVKTFKKITVKVLNKYKRI